MSSCGTYVVRSARARSERCQQPALARRGCAGKPRRCRVARSLQPGTGVRARERAASQETRRAACGLASRTCWNVVLGRPPRASQPRTSRCRRGRARRRPLTRGPGSWEICRPRGCHTYLAFVDIVSLPHLATCVRPSGDVWLVEKLAAHVAAQRVPREPPTSANGNPSTPARRQRRGTSTAPSPSPAPTARAR